jgi:hypothetical protein
MKLKLFFLLSTSILCCFAIAQKKDKPLAPDVNMPEKPGVKPASGPKPYSEVITDKAITSHGLFTVHKIDDKIFFEIPDSLAGRDVLIQSRISKAGAGMRGENGGRYAGDELSTTVIRFERSNHNKIFIRKISYAERSSDSTQAMFQSLSNSTVQPIIMSFEIKTIKKDSLSKHENWVIDVTDVINSDNDLFWGRSMGSYQPDRSYMVSVKTFPFNTEIKAVKTYMAMARPNASAGEGGPSQPITMELNSSLILLPEKPMQPRYADARVGFFTSGYTDFDVNPQGVKNIQMIARWRLEPKDEDIEKYKRGELVEPKKPIIIYIDPATPAKWIPYLIKGINDWQTAFEQAGFKNAIRGQRAPTPMEDSTWSEDDARHSLLIYKPSTIANAMGPHTSDPRSGEILETHISWFHNVMKLLQAWYMIQTSAVDKGARTMQFDDELMGELIRVVSSHEVGHTLGLMHNFGSSSTVPVEKLRDKKWVEANGHTPSIMDYARFNYVAQPEDNIGRAGLLPRIGVYDKWAIEWGYRLIPEAKTAQQEKPILNKWILDRSGDKRYWYCGGGDPRAQSEDIGDDPMKAGTYGIKNLKRILPNLKSWTKDPDGQYENFTSIYHELIGQFGRYMGHVSNYIGGVYKNIKTEQQTGAVFEPVPAAFQKRAVAFLNENIFITPRWIIDPSALSITGEPSLNIINSLQEQTLSSLVNDGLFKQFLDNEITDRDPYKLIDYLKDVQNDIWEELVTKKTIDVFRRNLQNMYVQKMIAIIAPAMEQENNPAGRPQKNVTPFSQQAAVAKAELVSLRSRIRVALPLFSDTMTRYHLQNIVDKIGEALNPK